MTKPARDANPCCLGFLLAALVAVLVTLFGAGTSSAATAQARARAHTSAAQVVEPHCVVGADRRVRSGQSTYDSVLAALPAAEGPVAAVSRAALGYGYAAAPTYDGSVRRVDARAAARVEPVGAQATVVPLRSQVDAASEASVAISGCATAAKTGGARIPGIIYRGGGKSPSNFRLREGEDALSFRDSMSNPLSPGSPVLRPGKDYVGIDTSRLPAGSVVPDGVVGSAHTPPGHVSVYLNDPDLLKAAIIESGRFLK
jgi:hypothetical protein